MTELEYSFPVDTSSSARRIIAKRIEPASTIWETRVIEASSRAPKEEYRA